MKYTMMTRNDMEIIDEILARLDDLENEVYDGSEDDDQDEDE